MARLGNLASSGVHLPRANRKDRRNGIKFLALTVFSVGASFARDEGRKVATLGERSRAKLAPTRKISAKLTAMGVETTPGRIPNLKVKIH